MGIAGMDYVVIDMEHGPHQLQDAVDGIKASNLRGFTPFVRIPSVDRENVLKLLDAGAMGLIIPCVQGVDDIKQLVKYGKYPPEGERGLAFARGSGWGFDSWIKDLGTYFSVCNRQQLLIPQCETLGCLNDLDLILAIDGVAGIFVGPFDLSAAMECPGEVNSPAFKDTVRKIMDSCHKVGKFCIMFVNTVSEAKEYFEMGMDSVAVGMDAPLYIRMYKAIVSELKD